MPNRMPSLFLSHGAPTLILEDCPARHFLGAMAEILDKPRAIVVMSSHYEADEIKIGGAIQPHTIHDFRGFPNELYAVTYNAPGAPDVALHIQHLLNRAGFDADIEDTRGLDHGIWNPLSLIYPRADIPVIPLSILPEETPQRHYEIGKALSQLTLEGVLLLGSGSITHNLKRFFGGSYQLDSPEEAFARDFAD